MISAERLKSLRKAAGKTQKAVAEGIGITTNSLQRFELGLAHPKLATVEKIADIYNVSIDYLVGRSDNPARL